MEEITPEQLEIAALKFQNLVLRIQLDADQIAASAVVKTDADRRVFEAVHQSTLRSTLDRYAATKADDDPALGSKLKQAFDANDFSFPWKD